MLKLLQTAIRRCLTLKLRKRFKDESGGATMVLGLALFALSLVIAGFIIDFTKNTQIKNDYINVGQRATQAALIYQNAVGGLQGTSSANGLINEYMLETRGATKYGVTQAGNGSTNNMQTQDTAAFRKSTCARSSEYPKISIFYDTGRHTPDYVIAHQDSFPHATSIGGAQIANGNGTNQLDDNAFASAKYKTITANIQDISDNYFYGMTSAGNNCQIYNVTVSSISSNSNDFQTGGN